jgi:hypothetical protein
LIEKRKQADGIIEGDADVIEPLLLFVGGRVRQFATERGGHRDEPTAVHTAREFTLERNWLVSPGVQMNLGARSFRSSGILGGCPATQ